MISKRNLFTLEQIPGKKVTKVLGYVKGSTVQTKNIGRDILAGLRTLVGEEIIAYGTAVILDDE